MVMGTHGLSSVIAATSMGAIAISFISYYYINRRKRLQQPPKNAKWQLIGSVEEIVYFPVRSAAAVSLSEAECEIDGLSSFGIKDRFLMCYNESGHCVYAGTYPQMLGITTVILNKNTLVLSAPEIEPLTINLELLKSKTHSIEEKRGATKLYLIEGEAEHHKWFSKVILRQQQGLKLFLCLKTEFEYNFMGEDKSDLIPIMVMNKASMNDLNQRLSLDNQAHHRQFRGNVLIKPLDTVKPYDEDNWSWLRVGEDMEANCILRYKAPCLRCILVNVKIDTCQRNPNFEPLKTLKKYRLVHDAKTPTLGAYYKVFQEGIIKQNAPVYAITS